MTASDEKRVPPTTVSTSGLRQAADPELAASCTSERECEQNAAAPPEVLTVDEVAALLRVNRKTVYAAFRRGELAGGRRIGGTIRFCRERVLEWLAEGQAPRSSRGQR
jgi:excisionase family DNA binding protein